MQESNQAPLTPQAERLVNALRSTENWINRAELARLSGKSALNKWDMVLLGKLAATKLIETRRVQRHGPIGYEWQYRAVKSEESE